LQVEAHQRDGLGDGAAVIQYHGFGSVTEGGKAEQPEVVAQFGREPRLTGGLLRAAYQPGHAQRRSPCFREHLSRQFQERPVQAHLWIVDGELGGVHTHGEPGGPGSAVVPEQGALMAIVQAASGRQGQRARGNDPSSQEPFFQRRSHPTNLRGRTQVRASELAVAHLELGRLVQRWAAGAHPVRHPADDAP